MPYIGKSPVGGGFHKLDNLTASATDTYALTLGGAAYYPETANQLLVSLNGVIQACQDSFTVSGSNLIFDSALTSSDSIDFVVALGDVLGVGSVTDGAITTAKLGNNAVTDAKLANTLDLSGKTLTMPTGAILQVKSSTKTDKQDTSSATPQDITGLSVSITPTSASSDILVRCDINYGGALDVYGAFFVKRDAANMVVSTAGTGLQTNSTFAVGGDSSNHQYKMNGVSHTYLDSPATTSAITYKVQFASMSGSLDLTVNSPVITTNAAYIIGGTSTITVMEIAG
ncbi:hypothetical protein OAT17_00800 [Flavobacteriaceae bacterium]|nr:hypothetical protein [Flavobacteriaceae bacterium]